MRVRWAVRRHRTQKGISLIGPSLGLDYWAGPNMGPGGYFGLFTFNKRPELYQILIIKYNSKNPLKIGLMNEK